jgi:hypothetical protein
VTLGDGWFLSGGDSLDALSFLECLCSNYLQQTVQSRVHIIMAINSGFAAYCRLLCAIALTMR